MKFARYVLLLLFKSSHLEQHISYLQDTQVLLLYTLNSLSTNSTSLDSRVEEGIHVSKYTLSLGHPSHSFPPSDYRALKKHIGGIRRAHQGIEQFTAPSTPWAAAHPPPEQRPRGPRFNSDASPRKPRYEDA